MTGVTKDMESVLKIINHVYQGNHDELDGNEQKRMALYDHIISTPESMSRREYDDAAETLTDNIGEDMCAVNIQVMDLIALQMKMVTGCSNGKIGYGYRQLR